MIYSGGKILIDAILNYTFLQNAILASILASIVCGIIGEIIVEKKLVMMSGGIAHTAYGGVGLGYLLGFEPIIGAIIFSILAAIGIGIVKKKNLANSDIIIALFWSLGMALGIIFIGLIPGYPPDINSYLFGNILSVSKSDLLIMLIMTVIVIVFALIFFNYWKVYLFDEEFAKILGLKTNLFNYVLLILIALTIVVLIRVAGIILVIALLSAPAAISALFSKKLKNRMLLSILIGIIFSFCGIWISYELNVSSGATIIILLTVIYFILTAVFSIINKKTNQ